MKIQFVNFSNIFKAKSGVTSAVILAAGNAERFGGGKLMAKLDSVPVLIRSITAFEECQLIDEIILVVNQTDKAAISELLLEYNFKKIKKIVSGGSTRQKSALIGFEAINQSSKYVAIHDAARCLVTPAQIELICRDAYAKRASTAAYKITDSVKYSDGKGNISYNIERDRVWGVTTPQVFLADLYRASAYTARDADFEATDDCMLAERAGFTVSLCDIGADNIKITFKDDIFRAEEILSRRNKNNA